jgi:predicted negative regulator of RcsB-dependent stress response
MGSEGNRYLEQVRDSSFFAVGKYELLGDYYLQQRQLYLAAAAYERALRINSGLRIPRLKLIRVYQAIAPEKVRAEGEKLKDIKMFYDLM